MKVQRQLECVLGVVACAALWGCSVANPLTAPHLNEAGSRIAGVVPSPLAGVVITSWIDSSERTMTVLTGNDAAVQSARSGGGGYPQGARLSAVTWDQAEDGRWFGARIPSSPRSVEELTVTSSAGPRSLYTYRKYEGVPLKRVVERDAVPADERIKFLAEQRAAVMP